MPPLDGSIIWARQIERHLHAYMCRVETVLGKPMKNVLPENEPVVRKAWENHVEGQKLKTYGDSFRLELKRYTQELFEDWLRKVTLSSLLTFCVENT